MDGVIGRVDGELSARDRDIAERLIIAVLRVKAIFRRQKEDAAGDCDTVFCPYGIVRGSDLIAAVRKGYVVFAGDAVTCGRCDLQTACPVKCDIVL